MPLETKSPAQRAREIEFIAERLVVTTAMGDVAREAVRQSFREPPNGEHTGHRGVSENASKKILLQAVDDAQARGGVDPKHYSEAHQYWQQIIEILETLREGPIAEILELVRTPQENDAASERDVQRSRIDERQVDPEDSQLVSRGGQGGVENEGSMLFSEDKHCENHFNSTLLKPGKYLADGVATMLNRKQIADIGHGTRRMMREGLDVPVFQATPGYDAGDARNCVGRISQCWLDNFGAIETQLLITSDEAADKLRAGRVTFPAATIVRNFQDGLGRLHGDVVRSIQLSSSPVASGVGPLSVQFAEDGETAGSVLRLSMATFLG